MDERYRLCYVSGRVAWFTTQELDEQDGDDWDDAPYEHNAGPPYAWDEWAYSFPPGVWIPNPEPPWEIDTVLWTGPFETPDAWSSNSPFSVDMINNHAVPWLQTDRYETENRVQIWAGCTYPDFVRLVLQGGGMVWVPITGSGRENPSE